MKKELKVTFRGEDILVDSQTTYKEVSDLFREYFDYDVLLCRANKSMVDLSEEIKRDCTVEFFDRSGIVGNRVYSRSVRFILILAIERVLGKKARLICHHSQDKGVYCTIENAEFNSDVLNKINNEMHNIVKENLPFVKMTVDRMDAIKYFRLRKMNDKAEVLKYISNTYINLYKLQDEVGYFYGKMAYSTGQIDKFSLNMINDEGFVIQIPDIINPECVLEYHHYEKVFEKFSQYTAWGKTLGVSSAADLNSIISSGKIDDLISLSEVFYNQQLGNIALKIKKSGARIVLMAGPSSSGKTTTSKKLAINLKCLGYNPHPISTDDYFIDVNDTQKDAEGNYNFEGLDVVDVELFNQHMIQLLNGEEISLPRFNFMIGQREDSGQKLKLGEKDIVIIEGIHALNDKLTQTIDRSDKYKIYISPLTPINIDNHTHVHTSDVRKLRRIIRDNKTRNKSAEETLQMWSNVQLGEINNIFPYQDEIDTVINSSLIYELGVLKTYVEPLLYNVSEDCSEYAEALRLINFLKNFLPIPSDAIPADSVLREFIGGSSFE